MAHGDKPGLSPKTVQNIHGVLHKALQQAVKIGYLRINASDACELPRAEKTEIMPLSEEEIQAFMKTIKGHKFETVFLVLMFTGIRRGEVCGLTWDHVNFERNTIYINRQLQQIPGQSGVFHLAPTKSGKGRTITAAFILSQYAHSMEKMKTESAARMDQFIKGVSGA